MSGPTGRKPGVLVVHGLFGELERIGILAVDQERRHAVELVRFAMYGQFQTTSFLVVSGCLLVFFAVAVVGYDPQRGMLKRTGGKGG